MKSRAATHTDDFPLRGSLKVVVRVLWSTKYRTPSRVYLISQPSGRGSSFCKLKDRDHQATPRH